MSRKDIRKDVKYYTTILDYINSKKEEFFWRKEIEEACNPEKDKSMGISIDMGIRTLSKKGLISCSDYKRSERQYYLVGRLLVLEDFYKSN